MFCFYHNICFSFLFLCTRFRVEGVLEFLTSHMVSGKKLDVVCTIEKKFPLFEILLEQIDKKLQEYGKIYGTMIFDIIDLIFFLL